MKFTIDLQNLPFEPDEKQIIYVSGSPDEAVTRCIRLNFPKIRDTFESRGYTFCYIPYVKQDLLSKDRLHYNAPFAKSATEADNMVGDNFILDYMLRPENREKVPPSLLYWTKDKGEYKGISISESTFEYDPGLSDILSEIICKIEDSKDSGLDFCLRVMDIGTGSAGDDIRFRSVERPLTADDRFDEESRLLISEIEERIDKLRQKGIDSYLIESMFRTSEQKLSRMHITKDFRIFLPDYFGMEIKMDPLPKALYLLFLNHPEGIMFSFLPDFRDEMLDLYMQIKGFWVNADKAKQRIIDVTDPLNNSINVNCTRINTAFISRFDRYLARYYCVDGLRGEPKKIILPRNLVRWEK